MKAKTKSYLMILATFALGALTGVLGVSLFGRLALKNVSQMRTESGFVEKFSGEIGITGQQMPQAAPVLKKYAAVYKTAADDYYYANMDMLAGIKSELQPVLNEDQLENLDDIIERAEFRMSLIGLPPAEGE